MTNRSVTDPEKILEKRAELLYLQAPVSNLTILLLALLFSFIFQDYSEARTFILWPVLLSIISFFRLTLWYLKKSTPDKFSPEQWILYYSIGTAIAGLIWGSTFLFPFTSHDLVLYSILLMIFFGVTASAVSVLSASLPAFVVYTLPIVVCFVIAINQHIQANGHILLFLSIVYYIMLFSIARNTNRHIFQSISLQHQNQNLIQQLHNEIDQRELLIQERTSQLQKSNQAIIDSEERLQNVINGAELGYWDWNYQTGYLEVNERWRSMLGLAQVDTDNNVSDWSARIHPDDKERMITTVEQSIREKKPYVADFRMKHKDGHWVWIQGSGSLIESDPVTHAPLRLCGTHQDVSDRKKMEKELEFQAKHDYLTHLFNRVELERQFQEEIIRCQRYQHTLSTFMIDIDHFKQINDTHGHQVGDETLKVFATFLQRLIRSSDYVARYGGEEFVVILPETSIEEAKELAERLRIEASKLVINIPPKDIHITISLGIASFPEDGSTYDSLLEAADAAMYKAKQNGRNRIHFIP